MQPYKFITRMVDYRPMLEPQALSEGEKKFVAFCREHNYPAEKFDIHLTCLGNEDFDCTLLTLLNGEIADIGVLYVDDQPVEIRITFSTGELLTLSVKKTVLAHPYDAIDECNVD